ncbi:MAG: LPS export ABC transporter periplasmic protein LptC [Alphaproteobacteria bacterium]|nr:LPS export ABC transporter periplasmic protein LptC [Alphaproteobacteria bacterium]
MFETQKIDTFFSGEKNPFEEEERSFVTRRIKVVRFFKLFLPSLTALLLGVGVALFDFDTTPDNTISLAEDEKIYFEKFRIKNTVFEITEKDNQFSVLKADVVEETTPGKKIYSLINPDANTTDKEKKISLIAKTGIYDETKKILQLNKDVVANYNNQLKINTNSALYNFTTEKGEGKEKIFGKTDTGSFVADSFNFDKKESIINLLKNVTIINNDLKLTTPQKATFFNNEKKFIATNATITKDKDTIKGDVVTVYFKDTKKFEIEKAYSVGNTEINSKDKTAYANKGEYIANKGIITLYENVKIVDKKGYIATADVGVYDISKRTFSLEKNVKIINKKNTITALKAVYFQDKEEFHFYDNINIMQENNTASADRGVYYIKKNIAELERNVIISKDGNIVRGDKAISDFNTSKSKLIAKKGGRISGKLIENKLKD